jgi:hypothetical protein
MIANARKQAMRVARLIGSERSYVTRNTSAALTAHNGLASRSFTLTFGRLGQPVSLG